MFPRKDHKLFEHFKLLILIVDLQSTVKIYLQIQDSPCILSIVNDMRQY